MLLRWWHNRSRDLKRFPADETGDTLWSMHQEGRDTNATRCVVFTFIFEKEDAAQRFQAMAESFGFMAMRVWYPAVQDWDVRCHLDMEPTYANIRYIESELAHIAIAQGGYADGWNFKSKDPHKQRSDRSIARLKAKQRRTK